MEQKQQGDTLSAAEQALYNSENGILNGFNIVLTIVADKETDHITERIIAWLSQQTGRSPEQLKHDIFHAICLVNDLNHRTQQTKEEAAGEKMRDKVKRFFLGDSFI